ncbi:uncharacterized protein LOC141858006 [Brevipalpus obovatus]|uniref:uncharacterized protein LOC141858006 n=1 Tax=Brevipalpus obovatus TaxID=246614 RepID=UPI003D9F5B4C
MSIELIMKRAREAILEDEQGEKKKAKKPKENVDRSSHVEEMPTKEDGQSEKSEKPDTKFDNVQNFAYQLGYELCRAYTKKMSNRKKRSKRKRSPVVDSDDEDTDDRTEAHIVCLNCGHYNQRNEPMCHWISCLMCNNWYHIECTAHWNKSEKEMEELQFICNSCT